MNTFYLFALLFLKCTIFNKSYYVYGSSDNNEIVCNGDYYYDFNSNPKSNFDLLTNSCDVINGTLRIMQCPEDSNSLTCFPDSIKSLKEISGNLMIYNNNKLSSLEIFNKLTKLGSLNIHKNGKLTSLEGFNNIIKLGSLNIEENNNLESLNGLNNLDEVYNEFWIYKNDKLKTVEGLNKIAKLGSFHINDNNNLETLNGLANIYEIKGQLAILFNDKLLTLNGLKKLAKLDSLYIDRNYAIKDIAFGTKKLKVKSAVFYNYTPMMIKPKSVFSFFKKICSRGIVRSSNAVAC